MASSISQYEDKLGLFDNFRISCFVFSFEKYVFFSTFPKLYTNFENKKELSFVSCNKLKQLLRENSEQETRNKKVTKCVYKSDLIIVNHHICKPCFVGTINGSTFLTPASEVVNAFLRLYR